MVAWHDVIRLVIVGPLWYDRRLAAVGRVVGDYVFVARFTRFVVLGGGDAPLGSVR